MQNGCNLRNGSDVQRSDKRGKTDLEGALRLTFFFLNTLRAQESNDQEEQASTRDKLAAGDVLLSRSRFAWSTILCIDGLIHMYSLTYAHVHAHVHVCEHVRVHKRTMFIPCAHPRAHPCTDPCSKINLHLCLWFMHWEAWMCKNKLAYICNVKCDLIFVHGSRTHVHVCVHMCILTHVLTYVRTCVHSCMCTNVPEYMHVKMVVTVNRDWFDPT